jgi:hypothetical protein
MTSFLFRIIGMLQIAGGFFGLAQVGQHLLAGASGMHLVIEVVGAILYAFVLVAGLLLVAGDGRGQSLSLWAQALQIPLIASPVLSYALHTGAFVNLYVTFASAHLGFDWHIGSYGWLLALAGPGAVRLGVNLLAVVSWLILRLR